MKLHSKRWLTEEINKTSFSKEFWKWTYDFLFYILINTRQAILHSINNEQINLASRFLNIFIANFPLYNFCSKTFCLRSNRSRQSTIKCKKTRIFNFNLPPISKRTKIAVQFMLGLFLMPPRMLLIFFLRVGFFPKP